MTSQETLIACLCLLIMNCTALPAPSFSQVDALKKLSVSNQPDSQLVEDLGSLPTNHAVAIATNPIDTNSLFFADETALYSFNKETGESTLIAGKESQGLLAMRSPVDGVGTAAAFKYITKIVSRPSGLYVFDYDSLRKYDYHSKAISTVTPLTSNGYGSYPITGVVSSDETTLYWTGMAKDDGHMVMSMEMGSKDLATAKHVTGGPTMIGHMELSADGQYLVLADVDMAIIEKVKVSDGDVSFVTNYGKPNFRPGAMAMNGDLLYAINREERSIDSYDITADSATEQEICGKSCEDQIMNPFDLAYDETSQQLLVLDGEFHPTLPTYIFSIKSITLGPKATAGGSSKQDFTRLLKFYTNWLASMDE
ncbi:uncharacterized protein [Watersipora subatra]|uniref:uncharacterized protein n=1 Tax=Watersipora subatra TaxID=2589382 RepID=UPI00355C14F6